MSDINTKYSPYSYPPEWYDEVKKLNIYQRLHGAMADAQPLSKTEKEGIKFKFHGHEAVSTMVKGLAEKWRFVVEPSVAEHRFEMAEMYGKPRPLCSLIVGVKFVNIDEPKDYVCVNTVGYGVDDSDKGPGKALSYALKMALLKQFLIYDGEKLDNEAFTHDQEREAKAMAEAKQRWAKLVKKLGYNMAEEGERMKVEYGNPPTLESILLDCEDMESILAKGAKQRAKKDSPAMPEPEPATVPAYVIRASELRPPEEDETWRHDS
jgi:hypothetical protein